MFNDRWLVSRVWHPAYEDPPKGDPPKGEEKPEPKPDDKGNFTQDQVNEFLAKDRRKHTDQLQTAVNELEALKAKSELTAAERTELDERIETLQNTLLTKEQLGEKETTKLKTTHKKEVTELTTDRDKWKKLHVGSTINRAITDAAVTNKAFVPEQIVAILGPATQLVEALDDEGNKTGQLVPQVEFNDHDKDKKPVVLKLSVGETVKRMTEIDKYLNLFEGEGTGGVGRKPTSSGKTADIAELAKGDPASYRKARKEGKITIT